MAILRVANQGQLSSALNSVRGGDTILLARGTYNELSLKEKFTSKVTIASADPGQPAVINKVMLRGAANVELKELKFDYVPGKSSDSPFWIEGGRGIVLNGIEIEGHRAGLYGQGIGLRVKNSQDVQVLNCEISDFRNGFSATNSGDVKVINNDFRGMSNDAMLLGGMSNMLIEGNDFREMKSPPALKHKDMIQFFTGAGSPASSDIVIRGNVIANPEASHGIYFTNPLANAGNLGARYTDILIEGNNIRSGHTHGISISHGDDVTIRGNVVLQHPEVGSKAPITIPLINVSYLSTDVVIQGNTVASVPREINASWTVAGNTVGGHNYQQWYGEYQSLKRGSTARLEEAARASADDGSDAGAGPAADDGDAGKATIRIDGGTLDDGSALVFDGLDFSRGDVIVFRNFDAGAFRNGGDGNPLEAWNGGRAVKVDSLNDLWELDARSQTIDATTKGDLLILRIVEDGETVEVALKGLGAAFRAAEPDLF